MYHKIAITCLMCNYTFKTIKIKKELFAEVINLVI